MVSNDPDSAALFIRIYSLIAVKLLTKKARQKVVFELWDEVLK
jgi:hypothetical protein